jgi:hypothetical protein
VINVLLPPWNAIADGNAHPLSELYGVVTAAQAHYPQVTRLDQSTDWAAIQAALTSPASGAVTTMVFLPRGTYILTDDLRVSRPIMLVGEGRGATRLVFAPGKGIIVDHAFSSLDGGDGAYTTLANLDLSGAPLPDIGQWRSGQPYVAGDRVWAPNDNRFYYECVQAGASRHAIPDWMPYTLYNPEAVVRPTASPCFRCIGSGIAPGGGPSHSGPAEPVWDLTVDSRTYDGEGALSREASDAVVWQRFLIPDDAPLPAPPPAWQPDTPYAVGALVQATAAFRAGLCFACAADGPAPSGGKEPAWAAAAPGEETPDNGLVWLRYPFMPKEPYVEARAWQPHTSYSKGQIVRGRLLDPAAGLLFQCTVQGTSGPGPNEPAWNAAPGATTEDGLAPAPGMTPLTWTCRRDPSFITDGGAVWVCRVAPGIWLRTQAYVYDSALSGFTNAGLHIQSSIFPGTNVNHWQVHNLGIYQCGLGVLVMGSDSQGGTGVGLEIVGNGYDTTGVVVPPGNGGSGIYDRGNAANNWVGCLTQSNTGRAFVSPTSNSQSIFIGCYVEADQQPSYLGMAAVALGAIGDLSPNSPGWVINHVDAVSPFQVWNAKGSQEIQTRVGVNDATNTALAWRAVNRASGAGAWWSLRWYEEEHLWATEWAYSTGYRASYLTGSDDHARGAGLQGFEGLLLGLAGGAPDLPIKLTADTQKPPPDYNATAQANGQPKRALYKKGDIVFNVDPRPFDPQDPNADPDRQYIGWVCVDDTNAAALVWKGFGKLES